MKAACATCPTRVQCEADAALGRELSKFYATLPTRKIIRKTPPPQK